MTAPDAAEAGGHSPLPMSVETNAKIFAVTIGMDALRIAIGHRPKVHTAETVIRWLQAMVKAGGPRHGE